MKGTLYGLTKNKNDIQTKAQWEKMIKEVNETGAAVIDGANIAAGSIYGRSIMAQTITAEEIKTGSITSDHITTQGILADKIKSGTLQSIKPLNQGGSFLNLNDGSFSFAGGALSWNGKDLSIQASSLNIGAQGVATQDELDKIKKNYIWMAYADNASGAGISKNPEGKTYIGFAYNQDTPEPAQLLPGDYQWQKATGADGSAGRGIASILPYYLATTASSGVTVSTAGWTTSPQPVTESKRYLWRYEKTQYTNPVSSENSTPIIIGVHGDKGQPGVPGAAGTSTFTWYKYADTQNGEGMSDDPAGKKYLGIAANKTTAIKGNNPSDYTWSAMYDEAILDDISLADKTEILSGEEIFTDKADDAVVHVGVDGKSYQSKADNLYSKELSLKGRYYYADGSIATSSNHHEIMEEYFPLSSGDVIIEQLWNPNGTVNTFSQNRIVFYDSNKSVLSAVNGIVLNGNSYQTKTHTAPKDTSLFRFGSITGVDGARDEAIEVSVSVNNPPTPSPDYPIAIESLNNFDMVSSVGKENLAINTGNMATFYVYKSVATKELIDENKSPSGKALKIKVTTTDPSGDIFYIPIADLTERKLEKGVKYTASFYMRASKNISLKLNQVNQASILDGYRDTISTAYKRVSFNFIPTVTGIEAGNHNAHFAFPNIDANGIEFYITPLKIEKSESPSLWNDSPSDISYDTRTETIYKTKLQLSEPLRSVGDVKDRLYRDSDGLWKVERNVGKKIFNGTESGWGNPDVAAPNTLRFFSNFNEFISGLPTGDYIDKSISSHFKNIKNYSGNIEQEGMFINHNRQLYLRINKSRLPENTLNAFLTWLKNNPMTLVFVKNPTIETLPQSEQVKLNNIQSFKGSNYVYTVDKSGISSENLKPTLHARFKSKAWYRNFRVDSQGIESQAQKFESARKDKKELDERYNKLYNHAKLSGGTKTALYNAKVAYNTKFTALETALAMFLLEKTPERLDELEDAYDGKNNYVDTKAILGVALDDAQTNITEGIADDKTGRNLWIANKYEYTGARAEPTIELIRTLTPSQSLFMQDDTTLSFNADYYIGHYFTYVYLENAKTIATTFAHDDGGSIYINGKKIYGTASTGASPTAVSLPFNKGWNQIDLMNFEVAGGDYVKLGHKLSTLVDDMSCYLGGGLSMSQIRQLNDEIDIRVQEGKVISAINLSKEGVRIEGKKIAINGETTFSDNIIMNAGRIQSKNGQSYLDLNNNTFKLGSGTNYLNWTGTKLDIVADTIRFGGGSMESVASTGDIQNAVDRLVVGGRNLVPKTNMGATEWRRGALNGNGIIESVSALGVSAVKCTIQSASTGYQVLFKELNPSVFQPTTQYTISYDVLTTYNANINTQITKPDGTDAIIHFGGVQTAANQWKKVTLTATTPSTLAPLGGQVVYITGINAVGSITIANLKIEKGNKATDWTPAPEDVDSRIDKSVKSSDVEYYLSTSATALSGGTWQSTAPTWVNGRYMWSRTKVVLNDGTTSYTPSVNGTCIAGATGATGGTGATGRGISSITEEYYLSSSKTTQTGGSWTITPPTWSTDKYMWTRSEIIYNNPAGTEYTTPLCDSSWEAVNEIQVGGENLVKGTSNSVTITGNNTANQVTVAYWFSVPTNTLANQDITFSFKWEVNGAGAPSGTLIIQGNNPYPSFCERINLSEKSGYNKLTANFPSSSLGFSRLNIRLDNVPTNVEVTIKEVKLERGNKATDWRPALADTEKAINDVAKAEADLAKVTAQAYADGKVSAEERRAIADAQAKLTEAKNHANTVAGNAETNAKNHANTQATTAERNAKNFTEQAILNDNTIKDTRNDNQTPAWYYTNYPKQQAREFKNTSTMGVAVAEGTYGILTTDVPWNSNAGGAVKQTFVVANRTYMRSGTSTAWTAWVEGIGKPDLRTTGEVVINGGNITVGRIKDQYNRSWLDLDTGQFSFGSGGLTWNGSSLVVKGNIDATSINTGTINIDRIPTINSDKIQAGSITLENLKRYSTTSTSNLYVGQWTKFATIRVTSRYGYCEMGFTFTGGGNGNGTAKQAEVIFRLKQQNEMGQSPAASMRYIKGVWIDNSDFGFLKTVNSSAYTAYDLFVRIREGYDSYAFKPDYVSSSSGNYTIYENSNFVASVPGMEISLDESFSPFANTVNGWKFSGKTTINGGNIETDTITAVQIKAGSITTDHLSAAGISADKITAGVLSDTNRRNTINLSTGQFSLGNGALTWNPSNSQLAITANSIRIGSTPVASQTDVSNAVNEIEIGGENLILGTSANPQEINASAWYKLIYEWRTEYVPISEIGLKVGDTFTYRVYIDATKNKVYGGYARLTFYSNTSGADKSSAAGNTIDSGKSGYSTITYTLGSKDTFMSVAINNSPAGTAPTENLLYSKAKIEFGNKATDWRPALVDTEKAINEKADNELVANLGDSVKDISDTLKEYDLDGMGQKISTTQQLANDADSLAKRNEEELREMLDESNPDSIKSLIIEQRTQWGSLADNFLLIDPKKPSLTIGKKENQVVFRDDSISFMSQGKQVAAITKQYLKIDHGIFAESAHIGRHQWAPASSDSSSADRNHFVLSYVGEFDV